MDSCYIWGLCTVGDEDILGDDSDDIGMTLAGANYHLCFGLAMTPSMHIDDDGGGGGSGQALPTSESHQPSKKTIFLALPYFLMREDELHSEGPFYRKKKWIVKFYEEMDSNEVFVQLGMKIFFG